MGSERAVLAHAIVSSGPSYAQIHSSAGHIFRNEDARWANNRKASHVCGTGSSNSPQQDQSYQGVLRLGLDLHSQITDMSKRSGDRYFQYPTASKPVLIVQKR